MEERIDAKGLTSGLWRQFEPRNVRRQTDSGLKVDILDPHRPDLDDAWAKAKGLAEYAALHIGDFGRIELIIVDGDDLHRLDLGDEAMRERVSSVSTNDHLRDIYANP